MKSPDKIYLPILPRIENSIISEHCVGTAWDNKEHITIPDIEEYIRKDAILEWAKELKERWEEPPMSKHSPGCVYMLEQLIDKLNSM